MPLACRAGSQHASRATPATTRRSARNVRLSSGAMPKRKLSRRCAAAAAAVEHVAGGTRVHLGRELSPSAVDGNGGTDLHYAAAVDWPATARALLAAGARRDARLRADREPLGSALVSTLSDYGQDGLHLLRRNGATPLHIAAIGDAASSVARVLKRGVDAGARAKRRRDGLARGGHEERRPGGAGAAQPRSARRRGDGRRGDSAGRDGDGELPAPGWRSGL